MVFFSVSVQFSIKMQNGADQRLVNLITFIWDFKITFSIMFCKTFFVIYIENKWLQNGLNWIALVNTTSKLMLYAC